jgi:hypothetical protein
MKIITILIFGFFFSSGCLGQNWRPLGAGVDFNVHCFVLDSSTNKLIVGGQFNHVDTFNATAIAVWDSVQWTPFGNNAEFKNPGGILAMAYFNNELILAGVFDSVNNIRMNNITKWNGTDWEQMGNGFDGTVYTLQVYNNELYAGGSFFFSGMDTVRYFAKWNGISWSLAAPGINNDVFSSTLYDGKLIIAGQFSQINSNSALKVASWNGFSWNGLGQGFNNNVGVLRNINDTLYVGGNFTSIPNNSSNWISKFDGSNWQPMPYPTGGTNSVFDITEYNHRLYLSGLFSNPEDLAVLNGLAYDSVGSAQGFISDMFVYKNELYVGGNFIRISNVTTNCIARYSDLATGLKYLPNSKFLIQAFPNPFQNYLQFNYPKDKIESVIIRDCAGKIVFNSIGRNLEKKLHLEALLPGIYIVQITSTSDEVYFLKIIKSND